jgi:hypothetical protein
MRLRVGSHQFRFFDRMAFYRVFQLVASRAGTESKLGTQSKEPDKVSVSPRGRAWSHVADFPSIIFALNSQTCDSRYARLIGPDVVDMRRDVIKHPMRESIPYRGIRIMNDQGE